MAEYWDKNILDEIVELLKEEKLYLFAGAGLSCLAGLPSWGELLNQFAEAYKGQLDADPGVIKEIEYLVESKDIVIINHLINTANGEDIYIDILRKNFTKPKYDITHKNMLELPFKGYMTINIDNCFETACKEYGIKQELINHRWFCFPEHRCFPQNYNELHNENQQFLFHMHGCVIHKGEYEFENLILEHSQYDKFYSSNMMRSFFEKFLMKHILFIGTSMKDAYFMHKLKSVRSQVKRNARYIRKTCYVILPRSEESNTPNSDRDEYDINYIYYKNNDHALIRDMIIELKEEYEGASMISKVAEPSMENKNL